MTKPADAHWVNFEHVAVVTLTLRVFLNFSLGFTFRFVAGFGFQNLWFANWEVKTLGGCVLQEQVVKEMNLTMGIEPTVTVDTSVIWKVFVYL